MAVQINVAANQAALMASIQAGVQAYNQRFANNNQINLNINARAFSQPLGRITGDVKDFEAALAASNARVIAFGASTAVLGGVIRSFKELAIATIEVEKNLTDINRVFGLTTSQLQKFSIELFNVSKTTATSFNEASKAALEFSRQGLKAEDTLQRTKDALTLTRLAGISTANAVDALTSTVNGFAQTGVTTTQILNKLVAVEQDYAVGAGDLAEALSRTGQAAQEAGVSLDQLNALVTAAQQSTARGGAVIGNALKTIFTRLQRTDTLDQLEAFNIAVRDVQGNILPAVQILQNFAGAYKGLADAQRAQLSEQVAGVYQVNILKAIVNDLNRSQGVYAGALQRGASATNEAEIATAKLNKTLDALLSQTGIATQQLANNIGKVTFEPLAKYGAEQLKSFVEGMNEILEGEGIGSTFANGFLKGIRNIIAGPGAIAAFFTLFKLIQNSFSYLTQALPQIAGITTEAQNRKNIETSILQILQQQGPIAQALVGATGNQAAQAQLLLQLARQQTAEYQQQTALAKNLATTLSAQGVAVKGGRGLQVTRAGGYIPSSTKMAEAVGAKAGGYSPGRVVKSPVGGVMNTAEDVKYVPGFAQPFINPPANSKAGRAHRQNAIARTGVDPYMYRGFIPNFAAAKLINVSEDDYKVIDGDTIKADATIQKLQSFRLSKIDAAESDQKYGDLATKVAKQKFPYAKDFSSSINVSGVAAYNRGVFDSDELVNSLIDKGYAVPDLRYVGNKDLLNRTLSAKRKKNNNGIWSEISNGQYIHPKAIQFINQLKTVDKNLYDNVFSYSAGRSFDEDIDIKKYDKKQKVKLYEAALSGRDKYNFAGFIPNFAVPLQTARIPWFKKYSSLYKNTSGDDDVFKIGDFPTYGRGLTHEYAKKGNANMLSYLHEDFVRSALNIALGSKQVIRPQDVGFKNKPISDISNSNDFDLLYRLADGSYSLLELKQDFKNISGSITGFMNAKLANAEKENPELVKKVRSMIAVSNMPKKFNPAIKNPADQNSEFEAAVSSIVKDKYSNVEPTIREKLTKVTDGLLRRYEAKKNSYFKGFIPNLAGITGMTNVARAVPFTSSDVFPKDTDLLGTVWQKRGSFGPVPVTNEGELNGLMNNLIASTLGSNVFLPNEENSTTGIEHAAKILSSGGRTKKGRNSGVVGQLLGNEMMDINLDNVYKATVTGKKNKLSYASLHKVLPKWWSKTPETKDAWQFLYNAAKNGTKLDNTTVKSKTSVLRDAYNNFLKKYDYVLTELQLDPYLRQVEGMGNVNYGVLREDLKGVADITRLSEREKTLSLEQTTGQYRQSQYYAKQKYDLLAKSVLPIRPSELEFYKNDNALLQMLREYGLPYGVYKSNSKVLAGLGNWKFNTTDRKQHLLFQGFIPNFIDPEKIKEILSRIKDKTSGFSEEEQRVFLSKYGSEAPFTASKKQVLSSGMLMSRLIDKLGLNYIRGRSVDQLNKDAKSGYMSGALNFDVPENLTFTDAAGFIPNFNIGLPIEKGYAFNDGRIYNAMYHAEAWDDIEGSTKGAIKYAVHRGKLLLQTNAAISDKLKQEFLKRGISPSAFSPVDDVDRNMRSKNIEDIDNAMKKLGDIHQLSGGIKGIYNRRKNEYTGLIKNGQFVDLYSRGGLSQDELKLHGGSIDSWLDRYNKTFSSGALQLSWKPITEELISNLSQYSAFRNFAGGFIPNFAYKQAVMSLEEGMSGQKAIFDTKPFPHIRNASQPTFSSAIADHGGLNNALSDSMRGQKAAGLMNNGFIPNFANRRQKAKKAKQRAASQNQQNTPTTGSQSGASYPYMPSNPSGGQPAAAPATPVFNDDDISNATEDFLNTVKNADEQMGLLASILGGRSKLIDAELNKLRTTLTAGGVSGQKLDKAMDKAQKEIYNQQSKVAKSLSAASTSISIAGPMLAGQIEQFVFANRKREDMSGTERQVQSGLSTGLTAISTGAGIGAAFGPVGAAIGGAVGVIIGFKSALEAAELTVEELTSLNEKEFSIKQQNIQSASSYIEGQKQLTDMISKGASSTEIETATKNLAIGFNQIKDTNLQEMFLAAGGDIAIMTRQLQDYTNKVNTERAFQKGLFESGDVRQTISDLSIGLNKDERSNFIKGLKNIKGTKKLEDYGVFGEGGGTDNLDAKRIRDFVITSDILGPLLAKRNITEKTDKNFTSNLLAANKKILDLTDAQIEELIKGLEKDQSLQDLTKVFSKFNKIATESYSAIFERISNNLQKQNFDLEKRFITATGENKIRESILEFSTGLNGFIDTFLSDTLDEFSKLQMAPQIARRKYAEGLNKIQLNTSKFQIDQEKSKNDFLEKNTSKLSDVFKSNILQSQQNALYFEKTLLPQIQQGDYSFDLPKVLEDLNNQNKQEAIEALGGSGMSSSINTADLMTEKGREQARSKISLKALSIGDADENAIKKLNDLLQAINALDKSSSFLTNANAKKAVQNAIDVAKQEKINFDTNQKYLQEENRIRSSFEAARLKAETELAVKRADVDKAILLRLGAMRQLVDELQVRSAINAARGNAQVQLTEARIQDPFRMLGQTVGENTRETIALENQAIEQRRKIEDATLNDQIQQAAIEISAREANTSALQKLTDAVFQLTSSILEQQIGSSDLDEMQRISNSEMTPDQKNLSLSTSFSKEQVAAFKAYQQLQQRNTASLGGYNYSEYKKELMKLDMNKKLSSEEKSGSVASLKARASDLGISTQEAEKLIQDQQTLSLYQQLEQIRTRALESKTKESDKIAEDARSLQNRLLKEKDVLGIQREIGDQIKKNNDGYKRMQSNFSGNFLIGVNNLRTQSSELINSLGRDLPKMFADGLVDGIKAAIRESENLGEALMGIASKFLDQVSTIMMQSAIYSLLGNMGFNVAGISAGAGAGGSGAGPGKRQKGGFIRAQSGMYISGTGSGDKYPALLENGEYVLNRRAVMAMGGPTELDKLNFSMAPRFASGGSFTQELTDLKSMEDGMTTFGQENSRLFDELRTAERQKQEEKRQKRRQRKQMIAGIVGSLAAIAVTAGLSKGFGMGEPKPGPPEPPKLPPPNSITVQKGGLIGSRLSDTIPAYAEGGLYNSSIVRKYGVGLQAGGMGSSVNNSNVVNNNNASNSFNFNTNVNRDGTVEIGANSTSYKQQDVELSQNLNNRIYGAVLDVIKDQQRFGGSLAGTRRAT